MNEVERIKEAYNKRKIQQKGNLYSYFNKGNLYMAQERERVILDLLRNFNFSNLSNKNILDIGCGTGGVLREFIKYGAKPKYLYGIDLLDDGIEIAKDISPNINFKCGNALNLPYKDEFFDIVVQFTVFTSILEDDMRKNIAIEMLRVLKKEGIIIWYDFSYDNPKNPDVKGIKKKEIVNLFPNCKFIFKRVTLAPPIVRFIAPRSWLLCSLFEKLSFLCTHYLIIIRKEMVLNENNTSNRGRQSYT
ncbi:MAG: class I SAM-dependent methyltransferase [Actinobacteria bacterium]|nr:class I SAM-dependent methyltransferase [Actinomycetota bacterium]